MQPSMFSIDGGAIGSLNISNVPDGPGTTYSIKARQEVGTFVLPNSSSFSLEISFDGNASGERGFIDYYYLTFLRSLSLYNNETDFRWTSDAGEIIRFEVSNATNATIWECYGSNKHYFTGV